MQRTCESGNTMTAEKPGFVSRVMRRCTLSSPGAEMSSNVGSCAELSGVVSRTESKLMSGRLDVDGKCEMRDARCEVRNANLYNGHFATRHDVHAQIVDVRMPLHIIHRAPTHNPHIQAGTSPSTSKRRPELHPLCDAQELDQRTPRFHQAVATRSYTSLADDEMWLIVILPMVLRMPDPSYHRPSHAPTGI